MTMIEADEMEWNKHDQQLDAQTKWFTPSQWKNRMVTYNMTKCTIWLNSFGTQYTILQSTNHDKCDY